VLDCKIIYEYILLITEKKTGMSHLKKNDIHVFVSVQVTI